MSINNNVDTRLRSEYQRAFLNILYTQNHLLSYLGSFFKHHDITRQQYNVLQILKQVYPGHVPVNLIKRKMIERKSDSSRLVERLRMKGLLTRTENSRDKRAVDIRITPAGMELLSEIEPKVEGFDRLLHPLSIKEILELNRMLDKIKGTELPETFENDPYQLMHQQQKF